MKLGDRVEHVIKSTGLHKLAPKDCGCKKRREVLNTLHDNTVKFSNRVVNKILK